MPTQFSKEHDTRLNLLEISLGETIEQLGEAQRHFDETWAEIFKTFDVASGRIGQPTRFICGDGFTLSREVTDPEERLDPAKLQELLAPEHWKAITDPSKERVLNQAKLAGAIRKGIIAPATIHQAMVKPKPVTSRQRRKTSKEDAAFIAGETIDIGEGERRKLA